MLATIREYLDPPNAFMPDAFQNKIGTIIPLTVPDGRKIECVLWDVEILEEGTCAQLTFKFPSELRGFLLGDVQNLSIEEDLA